MTRMAVCSMKSLQGYRRVAFRLAMSCVDFIVPMVLMFSKMAGRFADGPPGVVIVPSVISTTSVIIVFPWIPVSSAARMIPVVLIIPISSIASAIHVVPVIIPRVVVQRLNVIYRG